MTWKELFTTYGSFVTLVLVGIAYFIKRLLDLRSKKVELNYSFFQENKIKAIIKFIENYGNAERMWHHFPIYRAISRQMSADQLDDMIWPLMNKLRLSLIELTLYLEKDELSLFKAINENLLDLNAIILNFHSSISKIEEGSVKPANEFHLALIKVERENEELLKKIGEETRIRFFSK